MIASIRQWFAPPVFEGDEEKNRRAVFLNATLLMILSFLLFAVPISWLNGTTQAIVSAIETVFFLLFIALYYALRRGNVILAGCGVMILIFIGVSLRVIDHGTIRIPITSVYLLVIIVAGILFAWRGILVSVIACSLAVLGLIVAENAGSLPLPNYAVTISHWLIYVAVFSAIGSVYVWGQSLLQIALQRAETEIAERKQAEQTLNELESRLRLLSHNLDDAGLYVYSHDLQGNPHFEYLNIGMEKLNGVKIEDVLRDSSTVHSLILPEYIPKLVELEERSKQDLMKFEMEVRQKHSISGEIRWMLLRSTPRRRPDGSTVWYGIQMDVTERKKNEQLLEDVNRQLRLHVEKIEKLQSELREQSLRDPLTGLHNRRYLAETIVREIARARRENDYLSIIISDIDLFKTINDTYGHQAGDEFLIRVASLLKNNARSSDVVCRYGGEEFLLVIPGAGMQDAFKRANEIRQKCIEIVTEDVEHAFKLTMSFGVATYPTHGQDAEEIIIKADKALYQSKRMGRNCVTIWNESID